MNSRRRILACRIQKLDSCVPVMQPAQDCMCDDVPEALDRAPVRCILPERNMRTPPIIIGGEFRKNPPKVFFVEHDQMITPPKARSLSRTMYAGALSQGNAS